MRFCLLIFLTFMLAGCGIRITITNHYAVIGNENQIGQTLKTDSKPDVKTTTDVDASIPASLIP